MGAMARERACSEDDVVVMGAAIFEPAIVLPVQYLARRTLEPERRLMLAVLEDAIATLLGHGCVRGTRREDAVNDAQRWLDSDASDWPFSFTRVCEALGLDADYVRSGLARRRRAAAREPSAPRQRPFRRLAGARHAIGVR